jgi:CRISPR type III-A-associated RAMP protein Csm5
LRNLVSKSFDPAERQTWLFRSRISAEFEREYKEKLTDSDNQLLVQCMLHENGRAIIPGSSIKGAFRTAVLDGRFNYEKQKQHAEELQSFPDKKRANIVEGLILSAIKEGRHGEEFCIEKDPFRGLKIGDAVLPEDCTEIIKVQNVHINDTARTEGITMWVEAVAINTSFDFSLSLLPDSQLTIIDKKIKKDELVKASYNFFATALNNEDEKYYRNNKAASDAVQMVCRQPDNVPF